MVFYKVIGKGTEKRLYNCPQLAAKVAAQIGGKVVPIEIKPPIMIV